MSESKRRIEALFEKHGHEGRHYNYNMNQEAFILAALDVIMAELGMETERIEKVLKDLHDHQTSLLQTYVEASLKELLKPGPIKYTPPPPEVVTSPELLEVIRAQAATIERLFGMIERLSNPPAVHGVPS